MREGPAEYMVAYRHHIQNSKRQEKGIYFSLAVPLRDVLELFIHGQKCHYWRKQLQALA